MTNPHAVTRNQSGVLAASASVDSASIAGGVGGIQTVTVGHVEATQQQSCSSGTSTGSGSSTVDGLIVAGTPVSIVGGQVLDQTIAGVRIRTNQADGTRRQALIIDIGTTQYVLGDVRASGDACASLSTDNPAGQICPTGATYDVAANLCVIVRTTAGGATQTIVIGRPYAGPSGGSVLPLADAQQLARQGKLPHSPCLQGAGPKYVVLGTRGNDRITGTNGADRILGLTGNDRLDGGRGNDCVDGNGGSDTLTGGEGVDRVYGSAGNDHLNGGPGSDLLSGNSGNDTINTGFGRDRVTGGSGNDAINAATAGLPARINAGSGRDTVRINRNERRRTKHAETVHVIR